MNSYFCLIQLKSDARALAFAQSLDAWMTLLRDAGRISGWRLLRCKLNLASDAFTDFLLEITVTDLAQLDLAFGYLAEGGDDAIQRYDRMRQHIAQVEFGLYRPYPDPQGMERLALI